MKLVMRNWHWLMCVLAAGLICATYLFAQIQIKRNGGDTKPVKTRAAGVLPPDEVEIAQAALLIETINAGDVKTALEILHAHGVAEETLLEMAARLGQTPPKSMLEEPFLKATYGSLAVSGPTNRAYARALESPMPGYERPVMVVRRLSRGAIENYELDFAECLLPPVAVLNPNLDDPRLIRFFLWFDRYAERVHSIALNGENLNNEKLDPEHYSRANRTLNALFQLIKARKPDAFVWLGVVKQDSKTDELWLKAMRFRPDGLMIHNLRQFHSPFEQTRRRYTAIVGNDVPMMVAGFYGQKVALQNVEKLLSEASSKSNPKTRKAAEANALACLGSIGVVIGNELARTEAELRALGYRGLSVHWLLQAAMANTGKAGSIDKSDLINPRVQLLQTYYDAKDYAQLFDLAENMIANSAPDDMDWTLAKLAQGMALLSMKPPRTNEAVALLNEMLANDYAMGSGRDHYILCAAKWRIYAAWLAGDTAKIQKLVNRVQEQHFRSDLKSDFLKWYAKYYQPQPTNK